MNFPAQISSGFETKKEAREYAYQLPTGEQTKKIRIKNGFMVKDTFFYTIEKKANNATINENIQCDESKLYMDDFFNYCEIERY